MAIGSTVPVHNITKGTLNVTIVMRLPQNDSAYGAVSYQFTPKRFSVYTVECTHEEAIQIVEK